MADILKFTKPATKEHHDTMRQVSRSEMPSSLNENLKHIARAQLPEHFWHHACRGHRMATVRLIDGQVCPDCGIDKDGNYHGRGPAA